MKSDFCLAPSISSPAKAWKVTLMWNGAEPGMRRLASSLARWNHSMELFGSGATGRVRLLRLGPEAALCARRLRQRQATTRHSRSARLMGGLFKEHKRLNDRRPGRL